MQIKKRMINNYYSFDKVRYLIGRLFRPNELQPFLNSSNCIEFGIRVTRFSNRIGNYGFDRLFSNIPEQVLI